MKQSLVNIVPCGLLIRNLWLHWAHPVIHVTLHHKILNSVSPTGFRDLTRMFEGAASQLTTPSVHRRGTNEQVTSGGCGWRASVWLLIQTSTDGWSLWSKWHFCHQLIENAGWRGPLVKRVLSTEPFLCPDRGLNGDWGNTAAQMSQVWGLPLCSHRAHLFLPHIGWWKPVRPGDGRGTEVTQRMQTRKWQGELCETKPPARDHGIHWVLFATSLISKGNYNSIPQKSQEFQLVLF